MSKIIAIHANHGESTPGRRTPDGKFKEWDLNDAVVDAMEERMVQYEGLQVLRSDGDEGKIIESLKQHVDFAKKHNADLMITVDHNAYQGKWGNHGGTVTLISKQYNAYKEESRKIAKLVSDSIIKLTGMDGRSSSVNEADFYVLREATMPSINIEVGFMDSNKDYPIITDPEWQRKIGFNIADTVAKYYKLKLKEPTSVTEAKGKPVKTQPKFKYTNIPLAASRYSIKAPYSMDDIIGVTLHETDNDAPAINEIAYMQRNDNKVSFHYAVDATGVYQGVPLNRNTWNAGDGTNGTGNRKTISIEIRNNYKTNDLVEYRGGRAIAEKLVGWLMYVYGFEVDNIELAIKQHKDWNGKNCPRRIIADNYLPTFRENAKRHMEAYKDIKTEAPEKGTVKLEEGQRVRIKADAGRYANVDKLIPTWVKNQTHTILRVNEDTRAVLLKEIYSWVKMHDIEGYVGPNPSIPEALEFKIGDMVLVKPGAKSYDGLSVIAQWTTTPKRIDSINGSRVVLDRGNWSTPFNIKDLILVSAGVTPTKPEKPTTGFKVGDVVLVKQGAKSYSGGKVSTAWYLTPKAITELKGKRAVLDGKSWNTAFNTDDLVKSSGILPDQLKVGTRVIFAGTTYATGENVPERYRNKVYTIQQVDLSRERVLLKELYSWVKIRDLK